VLAAAAVTWLLVSAPAPSAAPPSTRTISLFNIHTKESLTVEYKKNGRFVPDALEKIEWILRDWRKDEKTKIDPELIDLLWEIHEELGSREPIHVISGYRSRATNNMLRASVGGQASESRHILGKAIDVHFPDVPIKRLRYSALVRERGGVGYYPTSAIPFVHLDTDRVRHWPRMPRDELALLFPDGRTHHVPADGVPLTPEDARIAKARSRELATQIAEFQELRRNPAAVRYAAAGTGLTIPGWSQPKQSGPVSGDGGSEALPQPRLLAEPRLVDRPSRLTRVIAQEDQERLTQVVALASYGGGGSRKFGTDRQGRRPGPPLEPGPNWAVAPAYDDEHPEELAYRPFPIAPYLTETPSPDDPALAYMQHPDVAKTLELLDQVGSMPPMRLRPGLQTVQLLWAQQFKGEAVALGTAFGGPLPQSSPDSSPRVANGSVRSRQP
jgi:uncharacterized protein YcbK (DUF882 family)